MSQEVITTLSQHIEGALHDAIESRSPQSLYDPVVYTLDLKAKRIRPLLVCLAAGGVHGQPETALPAAVAIEMLHNFTLIHDDIMDNADTRRGQPSVFTKWGINTAILSGDVLFAHAYRKLRTLQIEPPDFIRIFDEFNNAVVIVCEGQASDMDFEQRDVVSLEEYEAMIYAKTAALLNSSLRIGGIIGGATESQLQALSQLGKTMGLAFQMQDDLLDAIGDAEKFGKVRGGDIIAGKKTFLMIGLLNKLSQNDRTALLKAINQPVKSTAYVDEIVALMYKYHVIQETQEKVEYLYGESHNAIKSLPQNTYTQALSVIVEQLRTREH